MCDQKDNVAKINHKGMEHFAKTLLSSFCFLLFLSARFFGACSCSAFCAFYYNLLWEERVCGEFRKILQHLMILLDCFLNGVKTHISEYLALLFYQSCITDRTQFHE